MLKYLIKDMREISKLIGVFSMVLCLGISATVNAADEAVPYVEKVEPGFDFDSGVWNQSLVIKDFRKPGAFSVMGRSFSTDAKVATEVHALRTGEALYLGVVCYDDDGPARKAGKTPSSSGMPQGNNFEIYIDGDLNEQQGYYQFIINPDGMAWLSKKGQVIPTSEWSYGAKQDDSAWKFWVRIPYQAINITNDTESVNANFFRNYKPSKEPKDAQYSTWQGSEPASFASLRTLYFEKP
jgi:hypothetical protein